MSFGDDIHEIIAENENGLLSNHASWERVRLADVASIQNGFPFASKLFSDKEGLPLVRIRDVMSGKASCFYLGQYSEEFIVNYGDLLIGMDGDFNSAFWTGGAALLNQRVCRVKNLSPEYDMRFLGYVIPGYLEAINRRTSSVTVKHLSSRTIESIPLPLPPLAEQRRIAEKIEALTARSRRARDALDALPALIDRYRQSILAAAFRGDLTTKGQVRDGRKLESDDGLYPIPQEWKWAAMQDLVSFGPQNGLYLPKSKYGSGHPILRINDFQDHSSAIAGEFRKVELSQSEQEVYGLSVGDIVINRVNAPSHLGKCMAVSERHVPAVFESNMMRLRVKGNVPARYVAYFLKSPGGRKALLSNANWAVNQASINQGDVLATPIPIPADSAEMVEIVNRIESALTKIEAFEAGMVSTFDRLATLDQSILAKAFRGELVPQDPNDEPASVLLERIRTERAAAGPAPRRGRLPKAAGGG